MTMIINTQLPAARHRRRRIDSATVLQARVSSFNTMPGPFEASVDQTDDTPAILMWIKANEGKQNASTSLASVQRMQAFTDSIADELDLRAVRSPRAPTSKPYAIRFEFHAR